MSDMLVRWITAGGVIRWRTRCAGDVCGLPLVFFLVSVATHTLSCAGQQAEIPQKKNSSAISHVHCPRRSD